MAILHLICFCVLVTCCYGQLASSCNDLDTTACVLFSNAKPDLCSDPSFSQSTCQRFCGNCPLECYNCPSPVLDPNDCNSTSTCAADQTCVTKHLLASDGHNEYIMTCDSKSFCEGSAFGFGALIGKRDVVSEDWTDTDDKSRFRRDVSFSCCDSDFCNFPMTTTTLPPTSPGAFPHGCNRDIVFMLDDSGSVGLTNFRHSVDFTKNVINEVDIGPTHAQTAFVVYSTRPTVGWYLNTYTNKNETIEALAQVRYVGGTTHTDDALELVRTTILNSKHGDRTANKNVVIVISDGRSTQKTDTINEANLLKSVSDDVISIVVGSGIDVAELNAIATDSHHVFDVRTYSNLPSILPQVMNIVCNA